MNLPELTGMKFNFIPLPFAKPSYTEYESEESPCKYARHFIIAILF